MAIEGRAFLFGDDVDTDQIYPGRYLALVNPDEVALHAMEGADPGFCERFVPGSIIVAGRNFGCGSSREHAPIGLKSIGVSCVVAESFGRIFYRNAINIGLPVLRCKGVYEAVREGDLVIVDLGEGRVVLPESGNILYGESLPGQIVETLCEGGLVSYVRRKLKEGDKNGKV